MVFSLVGFLISLCGVFLLHHLFRYEEQNAHRIASRVRSHADFFVLKSLHTANKIFRFLGRDFIRQIMHYFFHTVLSAALVFLKRSEQSLRNAMRANRTIAKNAERESEFRSKLEEVALHKVAVALTEEEKKEHREKILNGM